MEDSLLACTTKNSKKKKYQKKNSSNIMHTKIKDIKTEHFYRISWQRGKKNTSELAETSLIFQV